MTARWRVAASPRSGLWLGGGVGGGRDRRAPWRRCDAARRLSLSHARYRGRYHRPCRGRRTGDFGRAHLLPRGLQFFVPPVHSCAIGAGVFAALIDGRSRSWRCAMRAAACHPGMTWRRQAGSAPALPARSPISCAARSRRSAHRTAEPLSDYASRNPEQQAPRNGYPRSGRCTSVERACVITAANAKANYESTDRAGSSRRRPRRKLRSRCIRAARLAAPISCLRIASTSRRCSPWIVRR